MNKSDHTGYKFSKHANPDSAKMMRMQSTGLDDNGRASTNSIALAAFRMFGSGSVSCDANPDRCTSFIVDTNPAKDLKRNEVKNLKKVNLKGSEKMG